ncbi:uncharacterized protein LOC143297391 [Babylonia areolata]|uniref:uncharacterized protein LOC143297391 n=1 Tax=Babylonia areolata TaxID=304850 RepID=UPI003FD3CE79
MLLLCNVVHSEHLFGAFDVKPSAKALYYQKKWQKYKCTFTYLAQGEEKEQWQFIMEKLSDGKMLRCSVSRGATSRVTFQNFTLSLTGPKVHLESYDAVSYLEQRLKDSEVKMDQKKRIVYAVEGEFQKKLERVTLTARVGKKTEL